MSKHSPPDNLGLGLLIGVVAGAVIGAALGAAPVGVAAGLGMGALVDWARYHSRQRSDTNKKSTES